MPHAEQPFLKTTFPFREHTIQTPSPNSAKHRILDQFKIKGPLKDLKHFLKKQNYALVYPLLRKLIWFGSRKRELQKKIQVELEILSSQQQKILERFQEMEEVGEQVRELLLLVKDLSERETERERGREDLDSLERRVDVLSGFFEQIFISAQTQRLVDSESSLRASEMNTSLDSLEEDTSAYSPTSQQSVPLEPSTPEEKRDKKEKAYRSLDGVPHFSDDEEFPFRDVTPPTVPFELSAPGGMRRMGEREPEQLALYRYGGSAGASLYSPRTLVRISKA